MLKRTVLSLTAVMILLGAGSSFAASASTVYLMNGKTTKAEVISLFGEPIDVSKSTSNREKHIYVKNGTKLEVLFENDVVWHSAEDSN